MMGALLHDFDGRNVHRAVGRERLSPGRSGDKRAISLSTRYGIGERPVCHPASVSPGLGQVTGGVAFFKLSKLLNQEDALSAPCLQHFRQSMWRDKGCEVWFSLGENHEKACRFDLHQLRNCLRGDFYSPQAPSRSAGMLRKGLIRHCHITVSGQRVIILTSADAFAVVGGRCTGRARRCKAKQGRRGKTALTYEYLLPH
jgi:hypothetical protein